MDHLAILDRYGIRAKKSLGQNFLVNDAILEDIATILDIAGKKVIEIGPGYGALTEKLIAEGPMNLTLIELDTAMIRILRSRINQKDLVIPPSVNFDISEGDVLKYIPLSPDYSVVANIPYYITSPILFRFFYEVEHKPTDMLILMQKEVGDKICKAKGYKNSYLSLAMEYACEEITDVLFVAKENFIPAPKIESSVLRFKRRSTFDSVAAKRFLQIISAGFVAPRKKLLSNLSGKFSISKESLLEIFGKLGWLETVRAEEVPLDGWMNLIQLLDLKN